MATYISVDPCAKNLTLAVVNVDEQMQMFVEKVIEKDLTEGGEKKRGEMTEVLTDLFTDRVERDVVHDMHGRRNVSMICECQGKTAVDNVVIQEVLRSLCHRIRIPFTLVTPPILSVKRKLKESRGPSTRTEKKKKVLAFYNEF